MILVEVCHELHNDVCEFKRYFFQVKKVTVCHHYSKTSSSFAWNCSVNFLISLKRHLTPTWLLPRHRKRVLTKVKITINLTILIMQVCKGVVCHFCELQIFRTSSKMFKLQVVVTVQRGDVTNQLTHSFISFVLRLTTTFLTWKSIFWIIYIFF